MEQTKTKKPIYKKWWFWLIIVVVILAIIGAAAGGNKKSGASSSTTSSSTTSSTASMQSNPQEESTPEETAIEVTAVDLIAAYDENEVSADNEYKDKTLKITGTVSDIGVDVANRSYIMLKDENDPYAILGVQCYFGDDQKDAIAQLKKGDAVTVTGTCEGKVVSVSIKDCQITK